MPWTMKDGAQVLLRPIRPEDEPLEYEMLTTLSGEAFRTRFFSVKGEVTHEMLVRFTNIDYDRQMAIVAEVRQGQRRKMIGIGRLIIESDFEAGEFAVLVHDDFQGKGLGYKLVDSIIGIADDKGLNEIYGEVLAENEKMLAVCRKMGFELERLEEDVTKVTFVLR